MSLTTTEVLQISDSIAQEFSDYYTNVSQALATPINNMIAGVSGQSGNATIARIMALASVPDLADLLALITRAKQVSDNVTSFLQNLLNLNPIYTVYFPLFDALDLQLGGLNAYLVSNSLQVNGFFANGFNLYAGLASQMGYRTSANLPVKLSAATYFPYVAIDNMWNFTSNGATTFSSNAVGANPNTSAFGGGVGQMYIYKSNAGNAAGGATFTITYSNAAGASAQATYNTASGTPAGSGSLSSGYSVTNLIGSAITAVTGSGMTSGEAYTIGMRLVRAPAY